MMDRGRDRFETILLAVFGLIAWRIALTRAERDFVRHPLRTALDKR